MRPKRRRVSKLPVRFFFCLFFLYLTPCKCVSICCFYTYASRAMRAFPSLFSCVQTEPEVVFPLWSQRLLSSSSSSSRLFVAPSVRACEIKDQIRESLLLLLPPRGREPKSVSLSGKHRSKSGSGCRPRKLTLHVEDNRRVPLIVYLWESRLLRVAI